MACKFKKNDYIMDTASKDLYFVINTLNDIVLARDEKDDTVTELTESYVNRFCTKVDLAMALLLYKDDSKLESKTNAK